MSRVRSRSLLPLVVVCLLALRVEAQDCTPVAPPVVTGITFSVGGVPKACSPADPCRPGSWIDFTAAGTFDPCTTYTWTISTVISGATSYETTQPFLTAPLNFRGSAMVRVIARNALGTFYSMPAALFSARHEIETIQLVIPDEGGIARLNVRRSGGVEPVSVSWRTVDGTHRKAGVNYVAASGTLNYAQGENSEILEIQTIDDAVYQPHGSFYIELFAPVGDVELPSSNGTVVTYDNDSPPKIGFTAGAFQVLEGNPSVDVTIVRTGDPSYEITATFVIGSFIPEIPAGQHSVTFAPGVMTRTLSIPVNRPADGLYLPPRETRIWLQGVLPAFVGYGEITNATLTVVDVDPVPILSIPPATVKEAPEGPTTVAIPVKLTAPLAAELVVQFTVRSGTAQQYLDYLEVGGRTLRIPAGVTEASIPLQVLSDSLTEPAETLQIEIVDVSLPIPMASDTAVVTILDNDVFPEAAVSIADTDVTEGTGGLTEGSFTIRLSKALDRPVTIDWTSFSELAVRDIDFQMPATGKATIPAGETAVAVPFMVVADALHEDQEKLRLELTGADTFLGWTNRSAHATIVDDDGTANLTVTGGEVTEGNGSGAFTMKLSWWSSSRIAVSYSIEGTATASSDFEPLSGSVVFEPGDTTRTIPVTIHDDLLDENNETVVLRIYSTGPPVPVANGTATLRILDDDVWTSTVRIEGTTVREGSSGTTSGEVAVRIAPITTLPINVQLVAVQGTATASTDYTITLPASVSIAPGSSVAMVPFTVIGDRLDEENETFFIYITGTDQPASVTADRATVTILDDEPRLAPAAVTLPQNASAGFSVDLRQPAQANGRIALDSSDSSVVSVPPFVDYAAGARQVMFIATAAGSGRASIVATVPSTIGGDLVANVDVTPRTDFPQLSRISPSRGPVAGGTELVITGVNFTPDCVVSIGGITTTTTFVTDALLRTTTPSRPAGAADITMQCGSDSAQLLNAFTFVASGRGRAVRH